MSAVDVAASVRGKGPPPYMVHGIGSRKEQWNALIEALEGEFTCVSFDLRGHGESPVPDTPYGLGQLVEDLEALRARLGHQQIHVVGHSLGGMIGPPTLVPIPIGCCPWGCSPLRPGAPRKIGPSSPACSKHCETTGSHARSAPWSIAGPPTSSRRPTRCRSKEARGSRRNSRERVPERVRCLREHRDGALTPRDRMPLPRPDGGVRQRLQPPSEPLHRRRTEALGARHPRRAQARHPQRSLGPGRRPIARVSAPGRLTRALRSRPHAAAPFRKRGMTRSPNSVMLLRIFS